MSENAHRVQMHHARIHGNAVLYLQVPLALVMHKSDGVSPPTLASRKSSETMMSIITSCRCLHFFS